MTTPKNIIIAVLALTIVGVLALSWKQSNELNELRTAALGRNERADLQKRVWDLEKENKQLASRAGTTRGEGSPGAPGPDGAPGRERPPVRGGNPAQQLLALRELSTKPEVQALMTLQQKAAVEARYAALFKSLNLTPDQAERLKTILADRATTMQDAAAIAREQGIDPRRDPEGYQRLMESTRVDINNSIKAVIGETGFAQFESFETTLPQRNVVSQLQQRLSYTDTPLTAAQSEQLVQILASNAPPPSADTPLPGGRGPAAPRESDLNALGALLTGSAAPGGGGGLFALAGGDLGLRGSNATAPITSGAVTQAQTVLSAPQVAALQQLQQQQQNQTQLARIVADTLGPNGAPPPPRGGPAPKGKQ